MPNQEKDIFTVLSSINVNDKVETKNGLSYLSWIYAWSEVKKRYPDASYTIVKNEQGLPYFADDRCGIMCYTTVTIGGITHEMWLPVMDSANNAMKFEAYETKTRFGTKTIAAATMFDVNKTVMRCLTKNLAMFGMGSYIYAGADLPEETEEEKQEKAKAAMEADELIKQIDEAVKKASAAAKTKEEKIAFASQHIKPIIGQQNYKLCKDPAKLQALLSHLLQLKQPNEQ